MIQVYGAAADVAIPPSIRYPTIKGPVMTIRSKLPYAGAALSAALYAAWLETKPFKYHPDVVWPNVTGGIALTGAWVAVRYAIEHEPRSLAWAWWVTLQMFVATGVPVVAWEEYARTDRGRAIIAYLRGVRRDKAEAGREPRRRVA
jgi:hypothetical protein